MPQQGRDAETARVVTSPPRRVPTYFFGSDYDGDQHLIADVGESDASQWIVEMWREDDVWVRVDSADAFPSYSQLEPGQVCWRTYDRQAPLRVWLPGESEPVILREGRDVVDAADRPCPQCGERMDRPWLWSATCEVCGAAATQACENCCSVVLPDGSRRHRGVQPCSCDSSTTS